MSSPSPLELLHPDGSVAGALVHGTGGATALTPNGKANAQGPPGIVLLAPSPREGRDRAWATEAARAASLVAEDGFVFVPGPSRALRVELAGAGLHPVTELLHVPDVPRSRYVFPLRGRAAGYALQRVVPLGPMKRIASRALALPGASHMAPTSVVFQRPGARRLLEWLCAIDHRRTACAAIVVRNWRPSGASVVYRFGDEREPDAVAKVGGGALSEARSLQTLGAAARGTAADVPELLGERGVGHFPAAIETAVSGSPAPRLLRGSPTRARNLLEAVARWLAGWNSATAAPRAFTSQDAERHVLGPARRLAAVVEDGGAHRSRLERLCNQCIGAVVPFVAAHNDLTAANILLADGGRLGIVDWEEASSDCLPLGDLAYAAVDFAAGVAGYRDRPAAFDACFRSDHAHAALTGELLETAAGSNGIEAPVVELCLQACWLHHADNEHREANARDLAERPFLEILRRAAAAPLA